MKRLIFFISFFLSVTGYLPAQTASEKFNDAMFAYNSSDFVNAVKLFDDFFSNYQLKDELYAAAKYYSSESLINSGNLDAAAAGFEFLVNHFKWSNFRDKSLYRLGLIYFEQKLFSKSRDRLKQLLDEYPESEHIGSALYWIGESYSAQNLLEEAIQFLEEAVQKRSNNKYIDYTIYTLASVYEKIGDYEKAVSYYDRLLSYHRESPLAVSAQIRIGICYFKLKDYHSSILELKNPMLANLPLDQYAESLYLLANSQYRVQEYENAEKTYLEIIQNFPSSDVIREVKYGLGWSYFQQKKYNDAYRIFNLLSEESDSIGIKSFYWKAEAKRYAGQDSEAYNIYKEFMERYPNHELVSNVQYQMGVIFFNSKRFEASENYLKAAVNSPDSDTRSRAYTMLGEIDLNRKKFGPARMSFEAALNVAGVQDDLVNRARLGFGISFYYLKRYKDAITQLSLIEKSDPHFESDKVNFFLAESYFASKNYSDALKYYDGVDPSNPELANSSLYGKAYCYFNIRQYENAAYQFSEFIKKYPRDTKIVDVRLRLADSYFGSKNYTAASNVYKDLFKTGLGTSNNSYVHYQYAQALYKAGQINDAINEFRNLQEKFPSSEFADRSLFVVSWIYFQQGNFSESISNYQSVLNLYPRSTLGSLIYYSIGDAYFNLGRYDSAIVNYQRVVVNYPNSNNVFDAINGIQYSYVALGQPEKAVSLIDEFVMKNPGLSFSDQLFFKKGEIYYSLRNYEAAKASYKEFISNFRKSKFVPDAYYWIGKSAQNLAQLDEALFNFNMVFDSYKSSESAVAAIIEICNIYNQQKNYDAALAAINKGVSSFSNSNRIPELLFIKANTLVNKGNIAAAYEVYDEIVQYYRGSIFAEKSKFELGLIELATKRYENAEIYFKDLAEKRSDDLGAKAQFHLGLTLYEQKKLTEAITAFVRVRTIFSSYTEWLARSYLKMGDIYVELKDYEKAKEMFRTVLSVHRGDPLGIEAQTKLRTLK
jgi:TolA-binding protein